MATANVKDGRSAAVKAGLEGVVVAETRLSDVDGEAGVLILAGDNVENVGLTGSFEAQAATLWRLGADAAEPDADAVARALGHARVAAFEARRGWEHALTQADGMDALRAALSTVPEGPGSPWEAAARVTGMAAAVACAWSRARGGQALVPPDAARGHAEDVLRMCTGTADGARTAGLQSYLVTVMDHGMNASTFAARVVASTGSDMVSAVVAGVGALKGPLHGGAPGPVLDMLDAVGEPGNAAGWLEGALAAGHRIMGMGHRIYRVRDPRAAVLERALERLENAGVSSGRLALARAVEHAAEGVLRQRHPSRPLHANVEFYTAVLLDTLGLPREAFTPMFTVGRVVGWAAHVMEQRRTGRLIRPASLYVGPAAH